METIGRDLREMQRIPLSASHVQALREAGTIASYPAGTFLALTARHLRGGRCARRLCQARCILGRRGIGRDL